MSGPTKVCCRKPQGAECCGDPEPVWLGCQQCDCSFACHDGAARCIRMPKLEPTDTELLNWLTRMVVNVRIPLRHGSGELFWASPQEVEGGDDTPSDLRAQIVYQMSGGVAP